MSDSTPIDLDELAKASFHLAADAFYWMREDGAFVLVNDAACRQLGYTREQLANLSVFDIDDRMTRELWAEHWRELEQRRNFSLPSVHKRADGSTFPVDVSVNYITTSHGTFNCAMVRDVTADREQQRIAQQHEALKTATIECALDSVISINEQGAIVEFNPAAEATFGHKREEVLGRQLAEVVIPEAMRDAHEQGFRKYLDTGIGPVLNQRLELPALHANGSTFPVEIAISPVNVAGQPMFTAYIRDITARKQAELELTDARAAAEQANEHKSRFLAQMSHEIRTPLTAIVGYADLLTHTEARDQTQVDWGLRIQENTRYLLSLVNDILDLSKIEAGESETNPTEVDLVEVLHSVEAMLRPRATEKLLDFKLEFGTAIPRQVRTDGTKLKQIVVNLAANAVRATSQGSIVIRMDVSEAAADDTATVTIAVRDTGCGIPEESKHQIFRPFVQIETDDQMPSAEFTAQTGLGLAISMQFAKLLRGTLDCESEVGKGSTFTLQVPVEQPRNYVDDPVFGDGHLRRAGDTPRMQGVRVLVVDDNPDNQQILRYLLEPTGGTIDVAGNGSEALERIGAAIADDEPFEVVLLDMQMPVMDGYQAIKAIRENQVRCHVIAVTAFATTGDREKCLAAGCDDYLTKPVEPAALYAALGRTPAATRQHVATGGTASERLFRDPVFAKLRRDFVASLERHHQAIEQAVAAGALADVMRIAHQLKGTGSSFGFPEITEVAGRCEHDLRAEDPSTDAIPPLLATLAQAVREHRDT